LKNSLDSFGSYLIIRTGILKWFTGRISKLVIDFIEASRFFIIYFLHKKTANILKPSALIQIWFDFYDPEKNIPLMTLFL